MILDEILKNNPKTFRKLTHLWSSLTNPKNYVIPETIEEFKHLGDIFAAKIKINSTDCYFNEKAKASLNDFVSSLYKIKEMESIVSYNFIYKITISFIESAIYDNPKHSQKPSPEKNIKELLRAIIHGQSTYQFYRIVEGVELKNMDSLLFGDDNVELFIFSAKHEKEIQSYRKYNNSNGFFDESVTPFIRKYFLNKICIRVITNGDEIRAKEIALKKMRQIINILRFIVCILAHERIYGNIVKVNLLTESYNISENIFTINVDDKRITLSSGRGRQSFQKLSINSNLINNLRECYFFDDWSLIFSKQNKTELEEAILTAIYWIGEAQNDFTYESAFIKYRIALETLFSISKKKVTESLARGVGILLAFGGYRFIEINDVKEIFKAVEKHYDKRSEIIHRGIYGKVTPLELSGICKYAVWCVLTCFGLRTQGYETLEQIRKETNRLYNLSAHID